MRNQLIKTFPTYHEEYHLSLDIKPISPVNAWANIIHVTKGGNFGEYGDAMPSIWFLLGTTKLYVCASTISTNKTNCYEGETNLPLAKFTHVQVSQVHQPDTRSYSLTVYVDGKLVHQIQNAEPTTLKNVKVYLGDPWYVSANALVKNVKISTHQGGLVIYFNFRNFCKFCNKKPDKFAP